MMVAFWWNNKCLSKALVILAIMFFVLGVFTMAAPGYARIASEMAISVNTTDDELNSDGDCSLREAIQSANLDAIVDGCIPQGGWDTINLGPGLYLFQIPGSGEENAAQGDLDIFDDLTISGSGVDTTIVDAAGLDRVFHVIGEHSVTFDHLSIQNGSAPDLGAYGGGGILNEGGILVLDNCVIQSNHAANTGGGIDNSGIATLSNTHLTANSAERGGGVFNDQLLTLQNVTLAGNTASETGGGIDNSQDAILTNVTISDNSAGNEGSGLFNDGIVTVLNSTIASNGKGVSNATNAVFRFKNTIVANSTEGDNCNGNFTSQGNNLDSGNSCNFTSNGDLSGEDPMLGMLENNEGPTPTIALLEGSPAIDSGNNVDCPATDQRNAFRPADGNEDGVETCDMGAFEFDGVFPTLYYLPVLIKY